MRPGGIRPAKLKSQSGHFNNITPHDENSRQSSSRADNVSPKKLRSSESHGALKEEGRSASQAAAKPPRYTNSQRSTTPKNNNTGSITLKKSINKFQQHASEQIKLVNDQLGMLVDLWDQHSIPLNHRTQYIEVVQDLNYDSLN